MIFKDRVAIVTGASSIGGIGEAVAAYLAKDGCSVVVVGRNQARTRLVADKIAKNGGKVLAVAADVSKPADVQRIVDETVKTFGKVDILANLAGIGLDLFLEECTLEDFHCLVDTNVTSMFLW